MDNINSDIGVDTTDDDSGDETRGNTHAQFVSASVSSTSSTSSVSPAMATVIPSVLPDRWLPVLQYITEAAMAHLELRELLRDLLARIREVMAVDNAAVLLVTEDQEELVVYAVCGPEEDATGKAFVRMGHGVAGTIAVRREATIIDDLRTVDVENPLLRATVQSLVGAPLIVSGRVLGVIHVDSAQQRHFTETELQLLQVIADRVALAIDRAQLYEAERAARHQAEATAQKLQALQLISDVALEHVQLDDLLRSLLGRIQDILKVDNVAILLPNEDQTALNLYTVYGPEEAVLGVVRIPYGEGVAGTIAATRRPLIVQNLANVPVANPFLREHFRSLVGVPLLVEGRLVGVLHADSVQERHFTDAECQLLETLGERIATAIVRAQIYEGTQREREAAERQVVDLHDTTERMDEFVAIASHELRTPLTSLSMHIQLLDHWLNDERTRQDNESDAEFVTRTLAKMRPLIGRSATNIDRLQRLVNDLLDASRIREGHLELRIRAINLTTIVHEIVEVHRQSHPKRKIRLVTNMSEPLLVEADPDRIGQVLDNFLANALKYSDLNAPLTVVMGTKNNMAQVSVRDKGAGIPQVELNKVWDRFYRVQGLEHRSGSQVGLGLGLYICQNIIVRHGGQVGVESTVDSGSIFWFSLPLASEAISDESEQ